MTKKASMRIHAKRRAFERYGLVLSRADFDEIANTLEDAAIGRLRGEDAPKKVCRQSMRITVWKMKVKGIWVQLAYDKERRCPATFLPLDMKPPTAGERAEHRRIWDEAMRGDIEDNGGTA